MLKKQNKKQTMNKGLKYGLITLGVVVVVGLAVFFGVYYGNSSSKSTPTHAPPKPTPQPRPSPTPHPTATPVPPDEWIGYNNFKSTEQELDQPLSGGAIVMTGQWLESLGIGMIASSNYAKFVMNPVKLSEDGVSILMQDVISLNSVDTSRGVGVGTMAVSSTGLAYIATCTYTDGNKVRTHVYTEDKTGKWVDSIDPVDYTGATFPSEFNQGYMMAEAFVDNRLNAGVLQRNQASGHQDVYCFNLNTDGSAAEQYRLSLRVDTTQGYGLAMNEEFCVAYYRDEAKNENRIEYFPAADHRYDNSKPGVFLSIAGDAFPLSEFIPLINYVSIGTDYIVWADATNINIAPRDDTFYDKTKAQTITLATLGITDFIALSSVQITNNDTLIVVASDVKVLSKNETPTGTDYFNTDTDNIGTFTGSELTSGVPESYSKSRGVGNMILPAADNGIDQNKWSVYEWILKSKQ